MIDDRQVSRIIGNDVLDTSGNKVGTAGQVYLDDISGQPAWVTVKTGLFGNSESFVPLDQATIAGDQLQIPYGKDQVKDAPRVDDDGQITPEQEAELYRYYGLTDGHETEESTVAGDDVRTGTTGYDTSGPTTDDAMTRSEERLHVGTEKIQAGRARLRKYVVTEHQQVNVPVTREEVRVEREPISEGNYDQAMAGPELSEEEHEVVLTEERAVVNKETVPVERVRLAKESVTEQQQVDAQVRKERIEADGDLPRDFRG
jgi:uncharacterized protein (TIGR02271 family)